MLLLQKRHCLVQAMLCVDSGEMEGSEARCTDGHAETTVNGHLVSGDKYHQPSTTPLVQLTSESRGEHEDLGSCSETWRKPSYHCVVQGF